MTDFKFSIPMTVRINDLNYANHVAHQQFFSYFQEARMAYLRQFNWTELDIDGFGMIMTEANCKYKRQLFYGDRIQVACNISELKPKQFNMLYEIKKSGIVCAEGFTANHIFDYKVAKIVSLPENFVKTVAEFEGLPF